VKHPIATLATCLMLAVTALPGCGWGILGGGGGGNNNRVTIVGSLRDTSVSDIVVLVFNVDDEVDDEDACRECGGLPCDIDSGDAVVIEGGEDNFTLERIEPGALRIVFLIDSGEDNAQIDDGDQVAILDDPDCQLGDVLNRRTVTIEDVELDFEEVDEDDIDNDRCRNNDDDTTTTTDEGFCNDDPPASGRARADEIRVSVTDDDDDDDDDDDN